MCIATVRFVLHFAMKAIRLLSMDATSWLPNSELRQTIFILSKYGSKYTVNLTEPIHFVKR